MTDVNVVVKKVAQEMKVSNQSIVHYTLNAFVDPELKDAHKQLIATLSFGFAQAPRTGFVSIASDLKGLAGGTSGEFVWLAVTETKERYPLTTDANRQQWTLGDILNLIGIKAIGNLLYLQPLINASKEFTRRGYVVVPELSALNATGEAPVSIALAAKDEPFVYVTLDFHRLLETSDRFTAFQEEAKTTDATELLKKIAGF